MNLQVIKSVEGKEEYVLLPIVTYRMLKKEIDRALDHEYVPFELEDYVDSAIAILRIKANLTQAQLAESMGVSQAYISKLEKQTNVSKKVLYKVQAAIKNHENL